MITANDSQRNKVEESVLYTKEKGEIIIDSLGLNYEIKTFKIEGKMKT